MQIKTLLQPLKWLKLKGLITPIVGKTTKNSHTLLVVKGYSHFGKLFGSYDPVILLIGTYATETKRYVHKDFHKNVLCSFIHSSKKLGTPKRPSVGELVNEL